MTSLFLLANLLFGLREPSPASANSPRRLALAPPCYNQATTAGRTLPAPFVSDAPVGFDTTPGAVQQRRSRFVGLVKMGSFERFDDARQEAIFKRSDPARSVHEPGPLEDEAIASAARDALAVEFARLGLKPRITCTAGKLSLDNLPDDLVTAASAIDTLLTLDGVRTVTATLPPSLRMP